MTIFNHFQDLIGIFLFFFPFFFFLRINYLILRDICNLTGGFDLWHLSDIRNLDLLNHEGDPDPPTGFIFQSFRVFGSSKSFTRSPFILLLIFYDYTII